jgi:hypothetical protein
VHIKGEAFARLRPIPIVAVTPVLALDTRPPGAGNAVATTGHTKADRWSHHPGGATRLDQAIVDRFNPRPGDWVALRNGLNVDGNGVPKDRTQIVPRAVLDLSTCPSVDAVLDAVRVDFFDFGIFFKVGDGAQALQKPTKLRNFAWDCAAAPQVPFGHGECLDDDGDSRIRIFATAGFPVCAPIMPQFTADKLPAGQERYAPLDWITGGKFNGSALVEYHLSHAGSNPSPPAQPVAVNSAGVPQAGPAQANGYDWPASEGASDEALSDLDHYHRDLFRIGLTGGIYSSRRGAGHNHVGLDLYAFVLHGKAAAGPAMQGEAIHAMMGGAYSLGNTPGIVKVEAPMNGERRRLELHHANLTATRGLVNRRSLVFRGAFLAFSGSNANAAGTDVLSKHAHMYYRREGLSMKQDDVGVLFGAAGSPVVAIGLNASNAAQQKVIDDARVNRYPRCQGKVTGLDDKPFPAHTVKVVVFDRTDDRPRYQPGVIATTFAGSDGKYHLDVPAGVLCEFTFYKMGASGKGSPLHSFRMVFGLGDDSSVSAVRRP